MPISNYLANIILDAYVGATAITLAGAAKYVALFTSHINQYDAYGALTEVSGGTYARVAITAATAAANKTKASTAAVTFLAPDWGTKTILAVGIMDSGPSGGGGNLLFYENICPFVVHDGDPAIVFPIGAIRETFDVGDCAC